MEQNKALARAVRDEDMSDTPKGCQGMVDSRRHSRSDVAVVGCDLLCHVSYSTGLYDSMGASDLTRWLDGYNAPRRHIGTAWHGGKTRGQPQRRSATK